jgi:hypothetical protein
VKFGPDAGSKKEISSPWPYSSKQQQGPPHFIDSIDQERRSRVLVYNLGASLGAENFVP